MIIIIASDALFFVLSALSKRYIFLAMAIVREKEKEREKKREKKKAVIGQLITY